MNDHQSDPVFQKDQLYVFLKDNMQNLIQIYLIRLQQFSLINYSMQQYLYIHQLMDMNIQGFYLHRHYQLSQQVAST